MKTGEVKKFVYEALVEAFGKFNVNVKEDGSMWLINGSAIVDVFIEEAPKPIIVFLSKVAMNVPYSDELAKYLLDLNIRLPFGAFGAIVENGSTIVIMKLSLIPEHITKEGIAIYLANMAETADELDDEIVDRFGGEKMIEFLQRMKEELEEGSVN